VDVCSLRLVEYSMVCIDETDIQALLSLFLARHVEWIPSLLSFIIASSATQGKIG
jgi:hypothetical protein